MKFLNTNETHTTQADKELLNHIWDNIGDLEGNEIDDLHFHLFNESEYVDNGNQAEKFIVENKLNSFEMIVYCQEKEKDNFGEIHTTFEDAQKLVNHYAYWRGEELLNDSLRYNVSKTRQKEINELLDDGGVITDRIIKEMRRELSKLVVSVEGIYRD